MSLAEAMMSGMVLIGGIMSLSALFLRWRGKTDNKPWFEIFDDEKSQFRFRLRAPDGEIIFQSEGYVSKQACEDALAVLPDYAKRAKIVDLT